MEAYVARKKISQLHEYLQSSLMLDRICFHLSISFTNAACCPSGASYLFQLCWRPKAKRTEVGTERMKEETVSK